MPSPVPSYIASFSNTEGLSVSRQAFLHGCAAHGQKIIAFALDFMAQKHFFVKTKQMAPSGQTEPFYHIYNFAGSLI